MDEDDEDESESDDDEDVDHNTAVDDGDNGKICMDLELEESALATTKKRRAQTQRAFYEKKKAKDAEKKATSLSLCPRMKIVFILYSS